MSEKPSFKDMAAMETSSVDAAFDPELRQAEKELRQAEKDWNDYLAHRKAAQGELDKNGKLRNIDGTFKNVEPNKERNNRLYDESLENTSRDSMGLVSLAKAAREAREQGDKTTQINIEDEIQERLIVSAEQNGWTSEQTDGMLNRLLAIMHGEGGIASVSNDNEVNPVEPAGTDEEVIALPGPAEAEPNKDADQADDAKAAEPAGEGNPYNRPVAENSLVPVVDEVEPWMKTWPGYGDKDGADKTEESKEPSQEEAPKFGSTPLIPADFLLTRLKQLDEQGGDWEGEYEKYTDAWEAYTTAHANARLNDVGSIIDRFATDKTKVGSWVKRTRDALGSKFNTRGHRRRQALADFEPRYLKAHEMALDEYGKLRDMTPVERELSSMLLHGDTLKTLEGEISRKRMNADQSRSFVSRKVGSILGIGTAVGLGALSAMLEDESKGQGNHLKWLTLGTVAGASAGYAAARRSRKGETQADINRRVVEGRDTMAYIAEDGGDITKMALALDAIETTTNAEQDKNRDRVAKITALGAGAAWASHLVGVEATETIADSGFFYNDTGTEANPWGVDFDPRDGNIDIIPDSGNIGGEGDSSLGDAATNTREALDAQVDEIVSSQPDVPVDTTVEVPEDATNPEIVDNTADTTSGGTQDDTGEVLGSQGGATEVYIQEGSSFTQETMELYPHLTVEQARDMYVDLMKTYRPEDIFSGVEFYRIEEGEWAGQWGMRDTGSATLTSTGRDAMNEWINANAQRGV